MRFAVFAIALLVRIVAIEVTGAHDVVFGDGADYIASARSLCVQHAYPVRGNLPFFRAPGLPFFIAGVTACHPDAVRAIKYGLAVCDALTCLLIFDLLRRRSALAGLLAALNPFFIAAVCDVRSEPLFMLLMTAALWLLLRERSAWSGVAVALAALTRPSALIALPLFALHRPRRALILLAAASLTLAPWTIRNYARFHEFIVVNDAGGFNLWRGSHPAMRRIASLSDGAEYARASRDFDTRLVGAVDAQIAAATPGQRSAAYQRLALAEIEAHPRQVARFTLRKAWLYWRPWLNPQEYDTARVVLSGLFEGLLLLLGLAAMWRRPLAPRVLLYFAVLWLAHLPFQVVMRFRIPYTDPLLIAFTASWPGRARADADSRSRSDGEAAA